MYSDNNFFASAFTFATTGSSSTSQQLPQPPSSAALVHGSNSGGGHYNNPFVGAAPFAAGANQAQPHVHYLQVPSRIHPPHREGRTSSRSAHHHHHGRARSKPYNIVKPIQKRVERTRRDSIASTPTRSSSRSRTPNLFIDQQQERPPNATPLSSSGQIHTPLANFEASFDGIAALGFDLDAFGSNERLMANSHTLSASS